MPELRVKIYEVNWPTIATFKDATTVEFRCKETLKVLATVDISDCCEKFDGPIGEDELCR